MSRSRCFKNGSHETTWKSLFQVSGNDSDPGLGMQWNSHEGLRRLPAGFLKNWSLWRGGESSDQKSCSVVNFANFPIFGPFFFCFPLLVDFLNPKHPWFASRWSTCDVTQTTPRCCGLFNGGANAGRDKYPFPESLVLFCCLVELSFGWPKDRKIELWERQIVFHQDRIVGSTRLLFVVKTLIQ